MLPAAINKKSSKKNPNRLISIVHSSSVFVHTALSVSPRKYTCTHARRAYKYTGAMSVYLYTRVPVAWLSYSGNRENYHCSVSLLWYIHCHGDEDLALMHETITCPQLDFSLNYIALIIISSLLCRENCLSLKTWWFPRLYF